MLRASEMSSLGKTTKEEKKMKSASVRDDDDESSSIAAKEEEHGICVEEEQISLNSLLSGEKLPATKKVFDKQCTYRAILSTPENGSSLEKSSKSYCLSTQAIEDVRLESARAEMGQVREENQRLKSMLSQIVKDYQSLQGQFFDVVQEEKNIKTDPSQNKLLLPYNQEDNKKAELLCLTLGLSSSRPKSDEERRNVLTMRSASVNNGNSELKQELSLGLDSGRIMSCDHESLNGTKEGGLSKTWPPNKVIRTVRSNDEQVLEQNHLKKQRVCVRVRCDTRTMDDGCQWRKYGQKISKGNPCPRAYYRCTLSPSCPVRKQVQRSVEDMSVLTTTYEGNHDHPLPIRAMAMASGTSAAASTIQSRSSTSQQQQQQQHHGLRSPPSSGPASAISTSDFYGRDFMDDRNPKLPRLYFSNSPPLSTCSPHPTITLDLTSSPDFPDQDRYRSSSCFPSLPMQSSTFLSFSSSPPSSSLSSDLATSTQKSSSAVGPWVLDHGMPPQHQFYLPHFLPVTNSQASHPQSLPDKLGDQATIATSSRLSFQSVLAATMTSFVSDLAPMFLAGKEKEGGFGLDLKLGDDPAPPVKSIQPSTQADGIPSASHSRDKPMAFSSLQGPQSSVWLPHSSVALSTSKKSIRASMSPAEAKNHLIKFLANSKM